MIKNNLSFQKSNISQTANWLIAKLAKTSTENSGGRQKRGGEGPAASVRLVVMDANRGVGGVGGSRPGIGPAGGGDDSHQQKPRGGSSCSGGTVRSSGSFQAAVPQSVRIGSVDIEERRTWRCGAGGCCSLLHLCYKEQGKACGQPSSCWSTFVSL